MNVVPNVVKPKQVEPKLPKLEACPYCGEEDRSKGPNVFKDDKNTKFPFTICCQTCWCRTGEFALEVLAIGAWNRRTEPRSTWKVVPKKLLKENRIKSGSTVLMSR